MSPQMVADGRKLKKLERHLWILETVKSSVISRDKLLAKLYLEFQISRQVALDDLNMLMTAGLIHLGLNNKIKDAEAPVMLTEEGKAYLQEKIKHREN